MKNSVIKYTSKKFSPHKKDKFLKTVKLDFEQFAWYDYPEFAPFTPEKYEIAIKIPLNEQQKKLRDVSLAVFLSIFQDSINLRCFPKILGSFQFEEIRKSKRTGKFNFVTSSTYTIR